MKDGDELIRSAAALVAIDECEPFMADAFLHREMRCGPYTGPQYSDELENFSSCPKTVQRAGRLQHAYQPTLACLLMQTKTCTICGEAKTLDQFHRSNRARGERTARGGMGVMAWCKPCKADRRKPGIIAARIEREQLAAQGLKRCGTCLVVLPFENFHVNKTQKDGRASLCPECVKANQRRWRAENPDSFSRWHAANRSRRSEYYRQWREANLEYHAQRFTDWAKRNPHKVNALKAKRHAAKLRATVSWADQEAIRAIYAEALRLTEETGTRHEVDHIVPLQGKNVCGLHWEGNLQILTKTENIRKLNRMPDDWAVAA